MRARASGLIFIAVFALATNGCGTGDAPPGGDAPGVVLQTSMGDITIELDSAKAPIAVENFLAYVDAGFYDGTVFHRVIPEFMVQGGGMNPDMTRKQVRDPIKNEADNGLTNDRGTVAMARTADVNSATSQFFINVKDNLFLNHGVRNFGYAVFGRVTEGLEVADAISMVATGARDAPLEPVHLISARRR